RFARSGGAVEIAPATLPDGVRLTFIDCGQSSSTAALIASVKALAEAHPARHDTQMARLPAHARAFAAAAAAGDAPSLVAAADAHGDALAALGQAAGVEIVTRAHALLSALARRHGGAGKPSGAGGGDLGVAFTVGADATRALHEDLRQSGLHVLSL